MLSIFKKQTRLTTKTEEIIAALRAGLLITPAGDKYRITSIRSYVNLLHWLRKYEQELGRIHAEEIDIAWGTDWVVWLQSQGLAKNTINSLVARLKAVLRRLCLQGIITFTGYGIRAGGELTTAVYNTLDELELLHNMQIESESLSRVRDVYIVQCFLGLRFGDLRKLLLHPERYFRVLQDREYFEIKTSKTGETVVIPISRIVREIFERRGVEGFGGLFSYQYYNRSIKAIAELAGLKDTIVHSRTQGGVREEIAFTKHELMSSHTARRTFATNAYLADVPVLAIMSITGHKAQSSFMRYIRCSATESAIRIADHPFFQDAFQIRLSDRPGQ